MQFRSIDGSGNNRANLSLGSANTAFGRIADANFADGVSSLVSGPNPRAISNAVVGQGDANIANKEGLSGMMHAWGQFIDHDLDLSRSDGRTPLNITIPDGDANFPAGTIISLTRAIIDPTTGVDAAHPATAVNSITTWLDASMVYGSNATTAASLRLPDGHLQTSEGRNLPIVNGRYAAGDVRAQENPALTALQTLFVREHNYQVDRLEKAHPNWTGDQLYQQARAIVGAEIANITYDEFLPHLLGKNAIDPYTGYKPKVDPRITLEFAGAAFRFGHSIVSPEVQRIDELGRILGAEMGLKDAFFLDAAGFAQNGGADGFLRQLASDSSRAMDVRIVDDLRNFLSDGAARMDLAAINIQRGRDLGLDTLNDTREALGLREYASFNQITTDKATAAALKQVYGTVDNVELWVGGLAETPARGAMVGTTFQAIITEQFENLRDGDRLWFERQGFDAKTLKQIQNTTLSDIIERNTSADYIQDDAFVYFERHSGTRGGVASDDPGARQLVIGSVGTDKLVGGAKADILVPETGGWQTLTGGAGADKFVFTEKGIKAVITDFRPGVDTIDFDRPGLHLPDLGSGGRLPAGVHYAKGSTILDIGGDHIVIQHVTPQQLFAHDFLLA